MSDETGVLTFPEYMRAAENVACTGLVRMADATVGGRLRVESVCRAIVMIVIGCGTN